jgi:hypothetical protein
MMVVWRVQFVYHTSYLKSGKQFKCGSVDAEIIIEDDDVVMVFLLGMSFTVWAVS